MPDHAPASAAALPSRSLRARVEAASSSVLGFVRRRGLLLLAIVALGLPLIVVGVLYSSASQEYSIARARATVAAARKAFDAHELDRCRKLALTIVSSPDVAAGDRFWAPLLLARVASEQAAQLGEPDRTRQWTLASRYFAEAEQRGVPAELRTSCALARGKSLFSSGQSAASVVVLEPVAAANGPEATEARRLLSLALSNQQHPNPTRALEHLTAYLQDPKLSTDARNEALCQAIKLRFQQDDLSEAIKLLDQLPAEAAARPATKLQRVRILVEQAEAASAGKAPSALDAKAREKWQAALAIVTPLAHDSEASDEVAGAAGYLAGRCQMMLGDQAAAAKAWDEVHHKHPFAPAAMSACLELASIRRREGNDDQAGALFHELARRFEEEADDGNPWLSVEELRKRLASEHQGLLDARKFTLALELAKLFEAVFPEDDRLLRAARTHAAWGRYLQEQAGSLTAAHAAGSLALAHEQYVLAGDAYRQLAPLRFSTREYPDCLWSAAENYLAGNDFIDAIQELDTYLEVEARARRSQALFEKGRALLSLGDPEEALIDFQDCIAWDAASVVSFQARLLASEAYLELDDTAKARAMLEQTLDHEALTPASQEWSEALLALGRLLYEAGDWPAAATRLDEYIRRYPKAPRTLEARYLLATVECKLAAVAKKKSQQADATNDDKLAVERRLNSALENYTLIIDRLGPRQDDDPLSPAEAAILRNCYFARGTILFDAGRYDEAVRSYLAIVNRDYDQPVVLEAYRRIFDCYRHLGRKDEARDALAMARTALAHLPSDAPLTETTNYSRAGWIELFDALATL